MIGFAIYTGEIEGYSEIVTSSEFRFGFGYILCVAAWLIDWIIGGITVVIVVAERRKSLPPYERTM